MFKALKISSLAIALAVTNGCAINMPNTELPKNSNYKLASTNIDTNTQRPTVIVAPGCDGASNSNYHSWAGRIRSWGYNTIVIDSFSHRGNSYICNKVYDVMPKETADDILELANIIKKQPWHKGPVGVIGFSHGASTALHIASLEEKNDVDFAIAYYPSCWFTFVGRDVTKLNIPTQVHLAEKDTWAPPSQCFFYKTNVEQYLYTNATHAFDMNFPNRVVAGHYLSYNGKADSLARERTREFLEKMALTKK